MLSVSSVGAVNTSVSRPVTRPSSTWIRAKPLFAAPHKNLLTGAGGESVFNADDKMDQVILDHKECTYSYFADPMYVFMDAEYNQYEVEAANMGDALNYLEDGMECEVEFYEGKAIAMELPTTVVREITWTEPGVKGDTSGKVLKPAKIATGFEVAVPLFVNQGDKIEIDTRTGEYRKRV